MAHARSPADGLTALDALQPELADHHRFHAALGHVHALAGDDAAARAAYGRAVALAPASRP